MEFYEPRDDYDTQPDYEGEPSQVQDSFRGASVLITGATGLIGRVLLEKILRSCPGVNKVFVLIRPKKGKTGDERIMEVFDDEVFLKLRLEQPLFMTRVVSVSGDCTLPKCGLEPEDWETMAAEVTHVFHAAAALRMDEHLRAAYAINVQATKDLIALAESMNKLRAFIYVSTAYSQTLRRYSEEKFYEPPYNDSEVKQILDSMDDIAVGALTPKLMGAPEQNTYAFTKALAEDVVKSYVGKIPIGIIRPSIVIGCAFEPLVCWINNIYGATGVLLAASIGLMRTWYGDQDKVADLIPADYVVNSAIAAAWEVEKAFKKKDEIPDYTPIYNVVSSAKAPMTWGDYMNFNAQVGMHDMIVSCRAVGGYSFRLQKSLFLYYLQIYFWHVIPGFCTDLILRIVGKEPKLFKGYIKIHNFNMQLGYYSDRDWIYNQDNVDKLWSRMNNRDRKLFFLDMTNFEWKQYYLFCLRGLRMYILKDPMSTLEYARKRYAKWDRIFSTITWLNRLIMLWIVYSLYSKYYS